MNFKRLSIAIVIAALIVGIGIYWPGQENVNNQSESTSQSQQTDNQADIEGKKWEVAPEASVNLVSGNTQTNVDSEDSYDRFNIPGRVIFPPNRSPTNIDLHVQIQQLKPSKANEIAGASNPKKALLKGDAENRFQELITKTVTTDDQGNFKLKNAPPGIYQVRTADTEWSGRTQEPSIESANRVTPLELNVNESARFVGHVVHPDGQPTDSAKIAYTTKNEEFRTDGRGQFTLESIEPGKNINHLKILKNGYKPYYLDEKPLKPGEVRHDTFILQKSARLRVSVKDSKGDPVTQGKLVLNRADDLEIKARQHLAPAHGGGKIAPLNEDGQYTFETLRPGKVTVTLNFSDYIPEVKTVDVSSGELSTATLKVKKGEPLRIKYINEKNGDPVTSVLPKVTVYDDDGNPLDPGYNIQDMSGDGTIQAYLDPRVQKFDISSRSRFGKFRSKTETFTTRDLPDVRISLVPSDRPTPKKPPAPPGLLKLESEGTVQWSDARKSSLFVIDRRSGERTLGRVGKNNILQEPLPLERGRYTISGLVNKSSEESLGFVKPVTIESKHPGKRTVSLQPTGSIEGKVSGLNNQVYGALRIGLSLAPRESIEKELEGNSVYYPKHLQSEISESGAFTFENVPSGTEMALHVIVKNAENFDVTSGTIIAAEHLSALSPGEERSNFSISVDR